MAETDIHYLLMTALRQTLDYFFADEPTIYVSGYLLMYYVRGNNRKHVAPDVFVVKGVEKKKRYYFKTWEERKTPNVVIKITSKNTGMEDIDTKFVLYRNTLKVKEYFLFGPFGDYLKPERLRGYRLRKSEYEPIALVDGRMLSKELALYLERAGDDLRLYDPLKNAWLLTPDERAGNERQRAVRAEQEGERLRKEIEQHKRRNGV